MKVAYSEGCCHFSVSDNLKINAASYASRFDEVISKIWRK